jgi:ParB-like chromosome segregation protein Spo0J
MSDLLFDIKTRRVKLSDLISPEYNPKQSIHDCPKEYEALYNSISKLHYIEPIVVNVKDGKNTVVDGNQRYAVICDMAEEKGISLDKVEIDVVIVEQLDEEELTANIGLNKIHTDWATDRLKEALEQIEATNAELLTATGFSTEEIDKMINDVPIEKEPIEIVDFKIHLKLPIEYESLYEMYTNVNGDDAIKKELIKIITGAGNNETDKKAKAGRSGKAG